MGDLKKTKKKIDYYAKTEDGEEIKLNDDDVYVDDEAIDMLRGYIKTFAEKQKEKLKEEKEN